MQVMKVMAVMKGGGQRHVSALSRLLTFITFLTFITTAVFAADKPFAAPQTPEHPAASTAGSLLQVTLSLALVLAAVFAAAWVVRRLRGFGRFGANAIQVVADAPLGTKERAVLVQVGEQQLLLGVTQSQVNLLHVLPQPISIAPPPAPGGEQGNRPDFAAILKRSLGLK
ncbi:MAG TPA: flagellar biosynthetic protein FliO [Povalibacter sp.]|nr:flagellar biosynthetic protein FliO [Povalibacter sp.]